MANRDKWAGDPHQRGLPRQVDGNGDGVVGCDSGAVERQPDEYAVFFDGFESGDTAMWSVSSP